MSDRQCSPEWDQGKAIDLFYIKGRLGWKGLKASEFRDEGPFLITGTDFESGRVEWSRSVHISEGRFLESPEIVVQSGDILITKDGTIGKIAYVDLVPPPGRASLNSHLFLVRSHAGKVDSRFAFYVFQSDLFGRFANLKQTGSTRIGLPQRVFEQFDFPLPLFDEQKRIAELLSTIDDAIAQSEGLISKYQQVKSGMMHDLFTRGVTPDGRFRPLRPEAQHLYSESPLGWFPQEWQTKMLGELGEVVSGVTLGSKEDPCGSIEVPYLRVANVQDGYLDLAEIKTIRISPTLVKKLLLRSGDVLMNEGGDFDKLGRGTVWNDEISPCVHQNHVFRVRPYTGELRSVYLALWSQSEFGKKYFILSSKQSTNLASINSTQLKRFLVALPSPDEQVRIENRLSCANMRIEELRRERDKLRLLKAGLMRDLLTSSVRVDAAAPAIT